MTHGRKPLLSRDGYRPDHPMVRWTRRGVRSGEGARSCEPKYLRGGFEPATQPARLARRTSTQRARPRRCWNSRSSGGHRSRAASCRRSIHARSRRSLRPWLDRTGRHRSQRPPNPLSATRRATARPRNAAERHPSATTVARSERPGNCRNLPTRAADARSFGELEPHVAMLIPTHARTAMEPTAQFISQRTVLVHRRHRDIP